MIELPVMSSERDRAIFREAFGLPPEPPKIATVAKDWPDDIPALGNRIAALTPEKAEELREYLETRS